MDVLEAQTGSGIKKAVMPDRYSCEVFFHGEISEKACRGMSTVPRYNKLCHEGGCQCQWLSCPDCVDQGETDNIALPEGATLGVCEGGRCPFHAEKGHDAHRKDHYQGYRRQLGVVRMRDPDALYRELAAEEQSDVGIPKAVPQKSIPQKIFSSQEVEALVSEIKAYMEQIERPDKIKSPGTLLNGDPIEEAKRFRQALRATPKNKLGDKFKELKVSKYKFYAYIQLLELPKSIQKSIRKKQPEGKVRLPMNIAVQLTRLNRDELRIAVAEGALRHNLNEARVRRLIALIPERWKSPDRYAQLKKRQRNKK